MLRIFGGRPHGKDAVTRNGAKLERANMRMNRALVKLSTGVVMSDKTIMGDDQAQTSESSKKRVKVNDQVDTNMPSSSSQAS